VLPIVSRINPGDITVRHPWTGDAVVVHSFRHRGYWFYGSEREHHVMLDFVRLTGRGDTVFDVGGHIGFTTMLFSVLAPDGRVHVFEPGPDNLRYLRRNVATLGNVTVVAAAVGATPGRADLQVEDLSGQNNSLVPDEAALDRTSRSTNVRPHTSVVSVEVVALDAYAATGRVVPDFIKVDVEGFEWEVVQGATGLIDEHHPALMIELTRQREETVEWLQERGYAVLDERLREIDRPTWAGQNVFFLHRERHRSAIERFCTLSEP